MDRVATAGAAGKEGMVMGRRRFFGVRREKEKGKGVAGETGGGKEKEGRCQVM